MIPSTPETHELLASFNELAKIASLSSLEQVLEVLIREIPDLIGADGCSIFLLPQFVNQAEGELIRGDKHFSLSEVGDNIVILAATSQQKIQHLVGHAFYRKNEGITGWVFSHGIPLSLKNVADPNELLRVAPDLTWVNGYDESWQNHEHEDEKPLLAMPLRDNGGILGVIKFPGPKGNHAFSPLSEKVAILTAQIVSTAIRNSFVLKEQNSTMLHLMEISQKREMKDVLCEVTKSLTVMLHCGIANIYLNQDYSSIKLDVENGEIVKDTKVFQKGQGLTGWVYKTGKPLIIDNVSEFYTPVNLTDELLESISDGVSINDDDRIVQCESLSEIYENHIPVTLIAIPVWRGHEIYAILSVQAKYGKHQKRREPFTRDDMQLCESFATTISLAADKERERNLGNLLTDLGYLSGIQKLFDEVIQKIPEMILASTCSIYVQKSEVRGKVLELARTSRANLIEGKNIARVTYLLGEGKTGFCGLSQATLVVNNFGTGSTAEDLIERELNRIASFHKKDLVERLLNNEGIQTGIIQLRRGNQLLDQHKKHFFQLSKKTKILTNGLQSVKNDFYKSVSILLPWSFAAIPIKDDNDLFGVITITRTVPNSPFSFDDITLLESIAGHLAIVLRNIEMQEQREELMMSLAHEINTPLTGILAESENILSEMGNPDELSRLAKDNLVQVMRLHLLTETIMGVLSKHTSRREFKVESIEIPIKQACELFASEAAYKGCDIKEPQDAGDGKFPYIEMSMFDLAIAIKNIVHNAVKYSFDFSRKLEKRRYIKIWGAWADSAKKFYKVCVQNYGVGISQDEIDKRSIFEAYERGENANDRRRTGAGFGLAYARKIIEDIHHGRIEVTSIHQGGEAYLTTFTIVLPIRQAS